ncbi:endo alpha-1,4 polygalactosaminidase [Streptomonospora wellingtoniae]|uniref:Endo alpha-1,4 polygalactosaminidase n=1 Tax=Streptomonospora wellingtoniae TaxID=3075544 RepID=A0ABU2KNC3_9ACTN|nr:endo alpha-1,4 polygalactosaminidase [Streptomonospora sp. DSM 45055]MDT0300767.1 endo alpha-1,4 polygalactosaminidase [Streptomonospora sp. DSM 45055]
MTLRSAVRPLPMAALLAVAACAPSGPGDASVRPAAAEESAGSSGGQAASPEPPPAHAAFDYQIGGAYPLPEGVEAVVRDRLDEPAGGAYNVCYVNGFQVQPAELDRWREDHPELLLRDADGEPVVDADWDEALIDVSTADKREAAAEVVGGWIEGCAEDGFDAVELDNLDSWTRSQGLLGRADAVAFAELLAARAHAEGLAAGQKNAAELIKDADGGPVAGFDFAVTEECGRWNECGVYAGAYPDRVLDVEYRDQDMPAACSFGGLGVSAVLRDLDVATPDSAEYVYATCDGSAGPAIR